MSNLEATVAVSDGHPTRDELAPALELLEPRPVYLGPHQVVQRVLPNRDRRTIGAWCFVDHYGPEDVSAGRGMWVPPHPHTGLQTVSWLFSGEIHHRDSLGSDALVRPGELSLMTAGAGIAHSEASPADHPALLHGLQLWVALPTPARSEAPRDFTQYADLPGVTASGLWVKVVFGELLGVASHATSYSLLVGAELSVDGEGDIPLRRDFEYGVLGVDGDVLVEDRPLAPSTICYLGGGRSGVRISGGGRAFLLGGEPFAEELVMWWNFIGRTNDEIVAFRQAWNDGGEGQFGVVEGFPGERLVAPPLPAVPLKPRGRRR